MCTLYTTLLIKLNPENNFLRFGLRPWSGLTVKELFTSRGRTISNDRLRYVHATWLRNYIHPFALVFDFGEENFWQNETPTSQKTIQLLWQVLWIRYMLIWIRIRGSVSWNNESVSDPKKIPTFFFFIQSKKFFL